MLNIIEYDTVNKYKRYIPFDINSNSKLYFDKTLIHKIPYNPKEDLENLLCYIDKLNLSELVEIKNLIYDNNKLVGYSMINYKEYKSLRKFKYRNFELKKKDSAKIIKNFNLLLKNNLSYFDFHLGNILLNSNNNDIKICDIDGFSMEKDEDKKNSKLKEILSLVLAYLYSIDYRDIFNVLESSGIEEGIFINHCIFNTIDMTINNILDIVKEIKCDYVKKERQLIINKSKKLSDAGYSKYYR